MERQYNTVREWLDKATALRTASKEPKCADSPIRRLLAFSDSDGDFHYITLGVLRSQQGLSEEEKAMLPKPEGRKKLIEGE